ncbi:hypothetical protein EVAR_43729_1 [Eumeta japonica]|uniref:Uncharacterized protein n=1 Tax=Eumeta variegata TaxID=151549 RepID=A0A4C1XZN0_EUMVA|nr:hypothetical protein EVAR_43729_1 [Eumeta japonica]
MERWRRSLLPNWSQLPGSRFEHPADKNRNEAYHQKSRFTEGQAQEQTQEHLDSHNIKIESYDKQLVQISENIPQLICKVSSGISVLAVYTQGSTAGQFKVPSFRLRSNWNQEQAQTVLTLGFRDGALIVLKTRRE